MTAKERGVFIKVLLSTLDSKEEKILRLYFGIQQANRYSLEEISKSYKCSRDQIKRIKNKGVKSFRYRVINLRQILEREKQGTFFNDKEKLILICDKLKAFFERVDPKLICESLPLHYSKCLDEFMLTLIDGVDWSGHYKRKNLL